MSPRGKLKWREALLGSGVILLLVSMGSGNWGAVAITGLGLIVLLASLARTYDREGRYGPRRGKPGR